MHPGAAAGALHVCQAVTERSCSCALSPDQQWHHQVAGVEISCTALFLQIPNAAIIGLQKRQAS